VAVARNADVLTYSAVGVADSFPQTVTVDFTPGQISQAGQVLEVSDNSSSDRFSVAMKAAGASNGLVVAASSTTADISSTATLLSGVNSTITLAGNTNDVELYVNGKSTGTPDTSAAMPTGIVDINVGSDYNEASQPNGNIRAIIMRKGRLNDSQIHNQQNPR